ncbi:unnamed protein product [Gongylonema pulchrum]|uniref:Conserved plasma membrane protein n=1 Tax=Gongylonema pulchrum TaxID=637853 RepID=A0A183CZD7_9BILA|nr:unnamed protein product [Gongylonema pulchrum]
MILFLGNMFYGVVLIGCHVVFSLGFWRYSESPVEVPYFRMGEGLLVFSISLLQLISVCHPALLLSVTLLNVVAASVALFMAALLVTVTGVRWIIIEVALILAATAALACVICTFCATFAALSSLYSMHRKPTSSISTIVPIEENNYGTLRTLVTPQLQEQSIYWSADENPYYYQASKRYYDQPYKIDSGFYGYALVSPHVFDSPYAVMGDGGGGGSGPGRYLRRVNSAVTQTRIGHVFN